jgi:hypothetical protein
VRHHPFAGPFHRAVVDSIESSATAGAM